MPGTEAKSRFANLLVQRNEIEAQLGFELDWQELPESMACRIATWYPNASLEDENRWDEYLEWTVQRLIKMDQVLRPIIKMLP